MAECLRDVCRLCGGGGAAGIDRRHPHSKEKYHQVMLRALDVDVHTDEMGTHPPFVCHNCVKKLMKWWSAAKLKKKLQLNIEVCEFVLHRCERCVQPLGLSSLCDELNAVLVSHPSFFIWRGTNLMKIIHYGDSGRPEVEISINSTLTWLIEVCGVDVAGSGCPVLQDIPVTAGVPDVSRVLETIEAHNICSANRDFNKLVKSREGPAGQIPTSVTGRDIVQVYPYPTIRHNKCHLLVSKPGLLCEVCVMFRVDLNVMASRLGGSREVTTSSSIRNNTMSNAELQKKMKLMKMENKALKKRNAVLHTKITAMIQEESVEVNTQEGSFLHQAMQDGEKEFMMASIEGSPAGLLWEQQKASFQKGKGMRWHPAIIRFCIALQSKSSSSYNLLRESGFLKLPHPNTLHPYTHFGDPAPGFNADLVLRVISDMKLHTLPQHQREVCVLFDEMKIKASLVYSVRSGAVVGFVDVGSIGNEILQFEKRCQDEDISIASHVLVLMVRGIFTSLRTPIGYYPSLGVSSHQLYPCMWEAIMLLEAAGFSVRGLVSDGASPNRKFYRMHGPREEFLHSTPHPATNNQLYFFCDPPHLMKTTRNNWENSGCHNKTRNLHYKKQDIKWNHLLTLYDWDVGLNRSSPGLRRLHKISYEHLHLTPALRMRVYMATQVLSSTVVNALHALGRHDTKSTELFVEKFDKFFDCLNVSNPNASRNTQKAALAPYRSVDDWRFKWLKDDFLGFLDDWENEAKSHKNIDKDIKQRMCLSRETLEGLRITVHSFVELAKQLLMYPEVDYLLSERFNQDPLEMYFSKQRSAGGSSENPTAEQFGHNMMAFHVSRESIKASRHGNVRKHCGEKSTKCIDATPLPKRLKDK